MKLSTIGFTQTSAESFFHRLKQGKVRRVIDVRLNNVSQLAGFAKKDDLRFFLKTICGIEYTHCLELAPTQEMLDAYKKNKGSWNSYEASFLSLMTHRKVEIFLPSGVFDNACLLCSEYEPNHCHRKLVAEYLSGHASGMEIVHL